MKKLLLILFLLPACEHSVEGTYTVSMYIHFYCYNDNCIYIEAPGNPNDECRSSVSGRASITGEEEGILVIDLTVYTTCTYADYVSPVFMAYRFRRDGDILTAYTFDNEIAAEYELFFEDDILVLYREEISSEKRLQTTIRLTRSNCGHETCYSDSNCTEVLAECVSREACEKIHARQGTTGSWARDACEPI